MKASSLSSSALLVFALVWRNRYAKTKITGSAQCAKGINPVQRRRRSDIRGPFNDARKKACPARDDRRSKFAGMQDESGVDVGLFEATATEDEPVERNASSTMENGDKFYVSFRTAAVKDGKLGDEMGTWSIHRRPASEGREGQGKN